MTFRKGSRYRNTRGYRSDGASQRPFEGIRPRRIETAEAVLEHTLQDGDRLDLLALHYYNDVGKWWRILDANPAILHAGHLLLDDLSGTTILIPGPADQRSVK